MSSANVTHTPFFRIRNEIERQVGGWICQSTRGMLYDETLIFLLLLLFYSKKMGKASCFFFS